MNDKSSYEQLIEKKTGMTIEEIKKTPIEEIRERFCDHKYERLPTSSACDLEYYECERCKKRISY